LSSGDHCWFKRSTRKKRPVTRDIHIIIIIIIMMMMITIIMTITTTITLVSVSLNESSLHIRS
jgi:hypothetical protein